MDSQLEKLTTSIQAQTVQVKDLAGSVSDRVFLQRPDPKKWSMAEHVAHLSLVNEPYLNAMQGALQDGRARGLTGAGPFKGKWFAARFIRSWEPPPRWRLKTFKEMKPAPYLNTATVLSDFEAVQEKFVRTAADADGLDLGKIKFRSPFMRLMGFALLQGFELLEIHNRRHIWHLQRTAEMLP